MGPGNPARQNKFGSAKLTLNSTGGLDVDRLHMATGDYNGDGRDDLRQLILLN
ncbi:hypothetical protein [Streptomyces sp. NBC_00467]|uniref:hypothetical protein n=1 Tax=Streptomyces sp. NBC_00467 TaxID=2975752 RepID=UPI002E18E2BD